MEKGFMEAYDLKDAGGSVVHGMMRVDGMAFDTFDKDLEVAAAIVRNIKNIKIRDTDVILCTPPKSGTHWCFEILSMLLNGTSKLSDLMKIFTMLEQAPEVELDKFPSPRVLNTHIPYRMLPTQVKEKKAKIILLLRNPKDVAVSLYYHHLGIRTYNYEGKFSDHVKLFMQGSLEYNSWFDYVLDFEKALEAEPDRIHLVFFEDLKENCVEEITKIARFLGVPAAEDEDLIQGINASCQFESMKAGKSFSKDIAEKIFKDSETFNIFRKGEIGDWKNHVTVADNEAFDRLYERKMKDSKLKFRFEPTS